MGAGEDLVNNAASPAENPTIHATGTTGNPINDRADFSKKVESVQAVDVETPTNGQPNHAVNPLNDQTSGSANPVIAQANVAETPRNEAGGIEPDNPINDQLNDVENPANNRAGGAETETSTNDQLNIAETSVKDQAGGVGKILVHNEADAIENPLVDKQDAAENLVEKKADAIETLSNIKEDSVETPSNIEEDTVETPSNIKEDTVETPSNIKEDTVETPSNIKEDTVETPVSNKIDRLPAEAKEILISLADKWEDVLDASALQVIPLKGAMTNEVFQIKWPATSGETSRKVVVRIYGEGVDIFFDREDEIRTFEYMSKNGQGPRLLGRFTNGRVEEFIHARTLSASDLRDPSISALIAAKMKEFHDLDMPGEKKVNLWRTLRNWLNEAKRLSSPKEVEAFYLDTVDKEISILEKELSGAHQQIGFCHNDLQYGNIMLDEETNSVTIIDYEYASHNPVAYDIANHFCEMAANYHSETPHVLDYSNYPDFEERVRFILAYLRSSGEEPSESEMEHLLQEVEKYTLANHLFWGLWGIISGQVNTIEFDYKEYAKQRFQEYWARKPYLLSSDAPSPFNVPEGTGELASGGHTKGGKNTGIFRKMKRVLGLGLFRSKS
ncbi:probable choline kinase 2 [Vicia villosa]|uniref:probable choline kinase 2 n=1 Tax=Vicia villosa TaxID=3911 RepID=UPI00273BEEB6|nr:probable choline kinase 2 [Vicia villosa]XP_058749552.1 probable choline kinase 2 [Vicia villosa]XP_058749553.1 probable choline kinase 2 [Vicia villosa]XP_058749554.1 probable choline kinase 2 [Vicia villosa]